MLYYSKQQQLSQLGDLPVNEGICDEYVGNIQIMVNTAIDLGKYKGKKLVVDGKPSNDLRKALDKLLPTWQVLEPDRILAELVMTYGAPDKDFVCPELLESLKIDWKKIALISVAGVSLLGFVLVALGSKK